VVGALDQAVDRGVREQRRVGVDPPGGEPAVAGDEHPQVGGADDAHEEGRHRVDVADAVVALAAEGDGAALDRGVGRPVGAVAEADDRMGHGSEFSFVRSKSREGVRN
jgi:hypothetical protein